LDKVGELVEKAKAIVAGDPDKALLWRAYVALEYAVMDIKLRYNLVREAPPAKPAKKAIGIAEARSMLARLDLSGDKRRLLRDLRSCRDVVKALVASYDRRSTTS
jgi:hypothetical protein